MAGDWIKMRTNLDTDPAVVRISSALKMDRHGVVGRLHKIWAWANEHLSDGQDVPVDAEFLDSLIGTLGFSAELRRVGWLSGRDGCLSFPNFERHNFESAKRRAQDAERKRVSRKSEKCPQAKRTESGPEKRREEKSKKRERESERDEIPDSLSTDEFRKIWELYRRWWVGETGKRLDDIRSQFQLQELSRRGHDKAIRDLTMTMERSTNPGTIWDSDRKNGSNGEKPKRKIPRIV